MRAKHLRWLVRLREPSLTALVTLEVFLLFVVGPLTEIGVLSRGVGAVVISLLMTVVAVVVGSRDRVALVAIALTAGVSFAVSVARPFRPSPLMISLEAGGKLAAVVVLTWVVGAAVFGRGRVTIHRIQGAVAIYLQIGMIFAFAYALVLAVAPDAIRPVLAEGPRRSRELVYFSLATLTSTGYGDVVPVHPLARSLATFEAIFGQLFPATLLARLVTLEVTSRRR